MSLTIYWQTKPSAEGQKDSFSAIFYHIHIIARKATQFRQRILAT